MTTRRAMGQMLTEIAEGAMTAAASSGLRTTRVEVTLPVELGLRRAPAGEFELVGDLPRNRVRTDFDITPSRLTVVWEEYPLSPCEAGGGDHPQGGEGGGRPNAPSTALHAVPLPRFAGEEKIR